MFLDYRQKKDLGFTNHFWSILYFQINPTKKLVGSYTDIAWSEDQKPF
jgi:hypothetical protein